MFYCHVTIETLGKWHQTKNKPSLPLSDTKNIFLFHDLEHQVYTYDDSENPREPSSHSQPSLPNAVSVLAERAQRPNTGNPEEADDAGDQQEEQQRLQRCLSDPGPNKDEGKDEFSPS